MIKGRIAALLVAGCTLAASLVGCSGNTNAVFSFRDTVIDENEYVYLLSTYKGQLLQSYSRTVDDPSLWTTEVKDGTTFGDFFSALFINDIMGRAIWLQLFDEYELKLTDEQKKAVDDWIDEWIRYMGSKAELNAALEVYNVDAKMLRDIKLDDLRVTAVKEYLFGADGLMQPTDEDIEKCYLDTYYRTKFIRLSKEKEYDFGEDGKPIYLEEEGIFSVHAITEEEYAGKEALFDELQERLSAGEDFEVLMNEHTMESGMIYFEDGYYFNSSSAFMPDELKAKVIETEIGQWTVVETETDWYIAKRYELGEKPYLKAEYLQFMFSNLANDTLTVKQQEYIASLSEELVSHNDSLITTFPFVSLTPNFNFQ